MESVNIQECYIPDYYKRMLLLCLYQCIILKGCRPAEERIHKTSSRSAKTINLMNHYTLELIGFIKKNEREKIVNKLREIMNLEIIQRIRCPRNSNQKTVDHIIYAKDSYVKHFEVIVNYFETEFGIEIRRK